MDRGARQSVGSGTTEPARRHLVSGLTEVQFLVFSFFLKLSFFCLHLFYLHPGPLSPSSKACSRFSIRSLFCISPRGRFSAESRWHAWGLLTVWLFSRATCLGIPGSSVVKDSVCHAGGARDVGLIPGSGRFTGGEPGNPLQYSCLENPTHRGAWSTIVHGSQRVRHDWSD